MPKHDKPEGTRTMPIGVTPDHTSTTGMAYTLGPVLMETVRGLVMTTDAPGYSTLVLEANAPGRSRVAFMLYDPPAAGSSMPGTGMIAQMTPNEARTIADSLLRMADRVEQRG